MSCYFDLCCSNRKKNKNKNKNLKKFKNKYWTVLKNDIKKIYSNKCKICNNKINQNEKHIVRIYNRVYFLCSLNCYNSWISKLK